MVLAWTLTALLAQVIPGPIYQGRTDRPEAALAVNVVWGTTYVLPMVRALVRHGARATFFLGGRWAHEHPDMVRQLVAAGMEIGNHGHAHRHVGAMGLRQNLDEILSAQRAIEAAGGGRTRLYAPAYGEISPAVLQAAHALGYRTVMWSADTIDWRLSHTADIIADRARRGLRPGAIVLMHPTARTLAALPVILTWMQAHGLKPVTLARLLEPAGSAAAPT